MTMILMTGLPGAGKTLHALTHIKERSEKEGRPVFYSGINECKLPWTEFKAQEWWALPDGSIIIIDECQFTFPYKANGSSLPDYYENLAIHRSRGFDIYLITQHPTLVHNFVRKLIGQHFHSVRGFGDNATIYEWPKASAEPEKVKEQKAAVSKRWPFNKEAYNWYKSAELHTVRRKVPVKVYYVGIMAVAVVGALYWWIGSKSKTVAANPEPAAQAQMQSQDQNVATMAASSQAVQPGYQNPVEDAERYVWERTPRVAGLPETAPRYDGLTVPTRVPVPNMCVQIGDVRSGKPIRCQCYTQQATKIDVEFNMCMDIARNGRFMDFDPEPNRQRDNTAVQLADASHVDRSARILGARVPDTPMGPNYRSSSVSSFSEPVSQLEGARPAPNLNDGPPRDRTTRTEVAQ